MASFDAQMDFMNRLEQGVTEESLFAESFQKEYDAFTTQSHSSQEALQNRIDALRARISDLATEFSNQEPFNAIKLQLGQLKQDLQQFSNKQKELLKKISDGNQKLEEQEQQKKILQSQLDELHQERKQQPLPGSTTWQDEVRRFGASLCTTISHHSKTG